VDNVALVFLARDVLGAGNVGYGVVSAAYGVGMVLAPLAVLRWGGRVAPTALLLLGFALTGVGTTLTGLAPLLGAAVAVQAVAGAGNGLENLAADTLIGRTVPRPFLGRVFGITASGAYVASGLAYAAGGPLLALTSPRFVFVVAGVGVLGALLVVWRLLPRDADDFASRPPTASGAESAD
jgi:MFS family permease